jgi:hypothetical protein
VETAEGKRARQLIQRLADREWDVRDAAEREILAMGLQAVPLLRWAAASEDPEVRRRAMRLLPGMEHALLVRPRRYSFSVVDQPFAKVIEALRTQTGYKIESNLGFISNPPGPDGKVPPGERKFTYHFKEASWWQILDTLSNDVPIQPPGHYGDDIVRLYRGNAVGTPPYVGYDGGFRYVPTAIQINRSVDLSLNPDNPAVRSESLLLNMTLYAEPHMPFLGVDQPRLELARDDRKGSMLPTPSIDELEGGNGFGGRVVTRRYYGGGNKQPSVQVSIPLSAGAVGAKRLELLRGVVPVSLLVEQRPVVVTEEITKAKDLKKEVEGVEFHIREVKTMPNNQFQVQFSITNKANPSDYNFINTIYQRVELYDDKGVKFQNYGSSWGGGGPTVNLTLTFGNFNGKIGTPAKFIFHHWVTRTHEVAFELKDLPLP